MVNVTEIEHILMKRRIENGKVQTVEEEVGIVGVYPRWIGFSNLSRHVSDNETLHMNSLFQLGDSEKEIALKVAVGFPQIVLDENEIIISAEFAKFFDFNITQIGTELLDHSLSLNMTFDLLALFLNKK